MMNSKTIVEALFDWFANCEVLSSDSDLKVDYLGEDAEQYSIETVPCNRVIKKYIDGSEKCQYLFIFASRKLYSEDEQINIANLKFYEELEKWIAEQSINSRLPKLPENCTAQAVIVLSSGYVMYNDTKTARYQIQCQLTYINRR